MPTETAELRAPRNAGHSLANGRGRGEAEVCGDGRTCILNNIIMGISMFSARHLICSYTLWLQTATAALGSCGSIDM